MRILVAEDEKDMNKIIVKKLNSEGYSTDSCFDGEEALKYIECTEYDAIILDVMMPKRDGFSVINQIRKNGVHTPVIFLTARDTVADRVDGLNRGANDYLIKPFSFEELMARLRVMTRNNAGKLTNILTVADLEMDCSSHVVKRNGKIIALSAKEYAVLEYMMYNIGIVLSRMQIENHIWNYDYEGGTNVVDVYIRYLRKKIDENHENKLIHTVRGMGYVIREGV
ncbi:MAG: response regulator transcription factor [Spirochaetales bacterium]